MSHFKKATFERPFESLISASVAGDEDPIKGVSEAGTLGTKIPLGTGQDICLLSYPTTNRAQEESHPPQPLKIAAVHRVPGSIERKRKMWPEVEVHRKSQKAVIQLHRPRLPSGLSANPRDPIFKHDVTSLAQDLYSNFVPEQEKDRDVHGSTAAAEVGSNGSERGNAVHPSSSSSSSSFYDLSGGLDEGDQKLLQNNNNRSRKFAKGSKRSQLSPVYAPGPSRKRQRLYPCPGDAEQRQVPERSTSTSTPVDAVTVLGLGTSSSTSLEAMETLNTNCASSSSSALEPPSTHPMLSDSDLTGKAALRGVQLRFLVNEANAFVPSSPDWSSTDTEATTALVSSFPQGKEGGC